MTSSDKSYVIINHSPRTNGMDKNIFIQSRANLFLGLVSVSSIHFQTKRISKDIIYIWKFLKFLKQSSNNADTTTLLSYLKKIKKLIRQNIYYEFTVSWGCNIEKRLKNTKIELEEKFYHPRML